MSASPFASTLSVGGFVALAGARVRSLGLVQGTSVMSLGYQQKPSRWMRGALSPQRLEYPSGGAGQVYFPRGSLAVQQYLNEGGSYELEERTAAYNEARTQALTRLSAAAREAGAFAVVDVRIRRGEFGHARRAIEFTALGTAVTSDRFEADEKDPVAIAGVSGTEFWKLVESGVWPLGLVGGTSMAYVVSGYRTKFARLRASRRSYRNQEYGDYTEGLCNARLHAATRLRHEAIQLGASGVLGVSVEWKLKEQSDDNLVVTLDLLGTAVASLEGATPPTVVYALGLGQGVSYDPSSLDGVPEAGRDRLRRMRETGGRFFTSDLSVNEFLLIKQAGFEPLGAVVGSSIYHIGLQLRRWGKNQELDVLTQAMYHARELAMTRMEEEADSLGADGIVGVRLEVGRHEWGAELAEFIAIGTAVKHAAGELHRAPNGRPFTSDLSGQDFWTLLSAGFRPVGLVLGNCVYTTSRIRMSRVEPDG